MPVRRFLPLLFAGLVLAGCAGKDSAGEASGPDPSDPAVAAAGQQVLRFDGLKAPLETTVWANGTIAFQDTCNAGGCVTGTERAFRATDVSGELPSGVPVEVMATMTTTPSPLFGAFNLFLAAPESVVYYNVVELDHATGVGTLLAMLLPKGPVEVVVAGTAPGGDLPETDYTLSITLVAGPERVAPGAPIGVELGPGSNLTFQAPGQVKPAFLLYAPDDTLLGSFAGNATLPARAPRGEYVVLLPSGAPWGNLSSDTATSMRPLALRTELGPEGEVPANGAYDAAWTVEGTPFAVGIALYAPSDTTPFGGPLVSAGFEASLTGANGLAVESGFVCGFCLTFGYGETFGSGTGNPLVVAQPYDVHAESPGATAGLRIVPYARYLDRAT